MASLYWLILAILLLGAICTVLSNLNKLSIKANIFCFIAALVIAIYAFSPIFGWGLR